MTDNPTTGKPQCSKPRCEEDADAFYRGGPFVEPRCPDHATSDRLEVVRRV